MYKTETKTNTKNASPQLLIDAKKCFSVPLVAIGGITPKNAKPLLSAGADLLAVVSCLYHADRPDKVVNEFKKLFENYYESI
jgi:thiamine-phosphate pyrophosphorylase